MGIDKPLGYLLGLSLRVYKNQMVSECRKQGIELTFEQFVILNMLGSNCSVIQQDLANQFQKDKSVIVRQINGLLDKQLVGRLTNCDDKRKKNLTLTRKGLTILNEMKLIASELSGKLLAGITDHELEVFQNVLNKIQENGCAEEEHLNC